MIVHGTELISTICPRCGCRLYPAAQLQAHMDRHRLLDIRECSSTEGWHAHQKPKTHKPNYKGRPRLRDSDKVDSVNIKLTEIGPR